MQIKFDKETGLVPAIVQDCDTNVVLMLGYMNEESIAITKESKKVTFFSRSKQRIWTKGETSGHHLEFISMAADCDHDTLLVKANPNGPVCHKGTDTCWGETYESDNLNFISHLSNIIESRKTDPQANSYTSSLFEKGINKIAQKVGEEAVELVIEAKDNNDQLFLGEAADLLYHYLILLSAKGKSVNDVIDVLKSRHG